MLMLFQRISEWELNVVLEVRKKSQIEEKGRVSVQLE